MVVQGTNAIRAAAESSSNPSARRTSRPLRFAIIGSRGYPSTYGGYETLVRHLAPFLTLQGHEVTVYCRTKEHGRSEWLEENVHCVAPPGIDSKSLSTLSFGLTSTLDSRKRRFDAALVLNIANGFYLPLLDRWGIPTAINTDGIEWERAKWSRFGRSVFRLGAALTARSNSHLVADSRAIGRIWKERFDVDSTFIPYGADLVPTGSHERILPLGLVREQYLLVVARLIPENNVELTLEAARGVASPSYPLVVVGSANFDSPLERELLARQHDGSVRWLGHVSDQDLLTQLWANAGVYVHGHSVGGTNPALLQALAAGAPTLALDTPFNREVVEDPTHLYADSVNSLRQAMRRLIEDVDERRRLREQGKGIVQRRYQWDDVCARYESLLVEITHEGLVRHSAR